MPRWDSHRRLKQEVVDRHRDVLDTLRFGVTGSDVVSYSKRSVQISIGADKHKNHSSSRIKHALPDTLAQQLASLDLKGESSESNRDLGRKSYTYELEDKNQVYNDYNQCYIDSGLKSLPGTWVQNVAPSTRFVEHPKLRQLLDVKQELVNTTAIPATYLCTDLKSWSPSTLPNELRGIPYDMMIIDPPLESYSWDEPSLSREPVWSWDEIAALPVPQLAAHHSFVFLWVGSGTNNGLERGREVLAKWGYRRCEDVVWVRTSRPDDEAQSSSSLLRSSVQHCLMGIRGTVVRSDDAKFVHCNIDADVILWPGERVGEGDTSYLSPLRKPHELYDIAENFCLGTRRLELFGTNRNLRRGWLTVGSQVGPQFADWPHDEQAFIEPLTGSYTNRFVQEPPTCPLACRLNVLPFSQLCENLRPKTPPRRERSAKPLAIHPQSPLAANNMPAGPLQAQGWHYGVAMNGAPMYSFDQSSMQSPTYPPNLTPIWYDTSAAYQGMQDMYYPIPSNVYNVPSLHPFSLPMTPQYPPNMYASPSQPIHSTNYKETASAHFAGPRDAYEWATEMELPSRPWYPGSDESSQLFDRAWHHYPSRRHARSALLGQGAGGHETVSIRSDSERFSGAQVQVMQRNQGSERD
ncbi:mRNA (2'-O-methyladenosine-N(6)-)-methyltransferase [Malassezia yamatoensis]|uniref:mRNA (2'-O-methyladenosine-N(6)-)-methyltransferase n=1 Tax=Malassezia yamatoensis TaxID=253288 RepID=A0AAJ5YPT8_9BASI|nr:mRNA (2'-O-methyladenosine-N(6)-)-methyltransferase [Malassezia yamatoensis]